MSEEDELRHRKRWTDGRLLISAARQLAAAAARPGHPSEPSNCARSTVSLKLSKKRDRLNCEVPIKFKANRPFLGKNILSETTVAVPRNDMRTYLERSSRKRHHNGRCNADLPPGQENLLRELPVMMSARFLDFFIPSLLPAL